MSDSVVLMNVDARGVAHVTINRPEVNNAYNAAVIESLLEGVLALGTDDDVRVLVLRGNGRYFQAGADLKFLRQLSTASLDENLRMSQATTDLVRYLDQCPKPTVALVQGGAFGGGVGMVAACDVVIAADDARFSIAEVRWGLAPGVIIPQLREAIGFRNVRRYALSAEGFDARRAYEMGLVHELCPAADLEAVGADVVDAFLKCSASAIAETKAVLFETIGKAVDDPLATRLSVDHALRRRSEEGLEGLASFEQKREASWYPGPDSGSAA